MDVEYVRKGNLRLGLNEDHIKILEGLTANAQGLGLDVTMVSAEEVKDICPHLSDQVVGASWCPTDGHANPMKTTLAYFKRARELGVTFYLWGKSNSHQKDPWKSKTGCGGRWNHL